MNLNGLWDYALLSKSSAKQTKFQGKILVPFCMESALPGVGRTMMPDERLWYRREFTLPADWKSDRIMLNFDAVDWSSRPCGDVYDRKVVKIPVDTLMRMHSVLCEE